MTFYVSKLFVIVSHLIMVALDGPRVTLPYHEHSRVFHVSHIICAEFS